MAEQKPPQQRFYNIEKWRKLRALILQKLAEKPNTRTGNTSLNQ